MRRAAVLLCSAAVCSGLALWWSRAGGGAHGAGAAAPAATVAPVPALPAPARPAITDTAAPGGARLFFDPVLVTPCNLTPVQEQDVSSQTDGVLQQTLVHLGDEVTPGQLLARLDDGPLRPQVELLRLKAESEAAYRIAAAQFEEADLKVRYAEQANARGSRVVPSLEFKSYQLQRERYAQEMKRAQEERDMARKELEKAQRQLDYHEIRSAIAGVVVKVYKRDGEAVRQAEPLFRVANYRRLRVEGLCKASQANLLRPGLPALVEAEVRGEQLTELPGHTEAITALALSPAGALLASASEDRTAAVWDWANGRRLAVLPHPAEVHALAFAPTPAGAPARLLTAAGDGRLRAWELGRAEGAEPRVFTPAAAGALRALALSPDGKLAATGGEDKRITLWDLEAGTPRYAVAADAGLPAHQGAVTALQFTPDGHLVSAGRDNAVKVWRLGPDGARLVRTHAGRTGEVHAPGASPDGRRVLFDHGDELRVLDRDGGAVLSVLRARRQGRFQGLAQFSPSGRFLLTGSNTGRVHLWKAPAPPEEVAFFRAGYAAGLRRDSFAALLGLGAGTPLALAAAGELPQLWDVGGRELQHYAVPGVAVRAAAFAADESVVFTGGTDKVVRVWALPAAASRAQAPEARLCFVGQQIERGTELVRVRAEVDNPTDLPLRPGTQVTLRVYPELGAQR